MARPLRIEYEGAFYHITARGNERRKIFLSEDDCQKYLAKLSDAIPKFSIILHAYVLMGNHYHLIVETPRANLSAFMQALNSSYTTYFNIKRKRKTLTSHHLPPKERKSRCLSLQTKPPS